MEFDQWNMDVLNELLKHRDIERDYFDFKSTKLNKLGESLCAMANTITGILCLGVDHLRELYLSNQISRYHYLVKISVVA